jgi:two-component system cell cycle sensor histidine kinase/response regulator CckA
MSPDIPSSAALRPAVSSKQDGFAIPVPGDAASVGRIFQSQNIAQPTSAEDQPLTQLTLLDEVRDAVVIRDLEDRIRFWNKGAERLYGWRADEVVGQNFYDILIPARVEVREKQTSDLAETGEWIGELRQVTKVHKNIVVESHWKLQRDEFNRPSFVLIVNKDITEKKMLEGEILRAQRIETVGKLAIRIVHDLNTLLSTMLMSIRGLLREHNELRDLEGLESWQFSAGHAAELITQILLLAKGNNEELTASINVVHLIDEIARLLRSTFPQSIRIETTIPADLHSVFGNPTHLYQVLLNLCMNARDAMPCGGILRIAAANAVFDKNVVQTLPEATPGTYVLISVADTGIGIPPEITRKIFEPFFTTKARNKGTGLGLFTVATIVKDHNGFIDLTADLKPGAQFMIYLPAQKNHVDGE